MINSKSNDGSIKSLSDVVEYKIESVVSDDFRPITRITIDVYREALQDLKTMHNIDALGRVFELVVDDIKQSGYF